MGNSMKALAILNTVLLVGLIIFVLVAKSQTESGEKVSYFKPKAKEPIDADIEVPDGEIVE